MNHDLRLAPAAIGCWLSALTTLHTGITTGLWLTATTVALAALFGFLRFPSHDATARRPSDVARPVSPARAMAIRMPREGASAPHGAPDESALGQPGEGVRLATRVRGEDVAGVPWAGHGTGSSPWRLVAWVGAWRWTIAAACAGAACGAGVTVAHLAVRDAEPVAELVAQRATGEVELAVRTDPRLIKGGSWLVEADLVNVTGQFTADVRVLVLSRDQGWRPLLPGQHVTATVRFGPSRGGDLTAAVLSASSAPVPTGEVPWVQRAAGGLRERLQAAVEPLPDKPGGLLPGLVVGDTSRLTPELEEQFRETGMTHLCAVSGSNVAIVVGFILLLARWARLPPLWTAVACVIALAGFVILVRPSPSVVRAAAMGAIGLMSLASGRPKAALPALGAAAITLILLDPELATDPGFALSVTATSGLLFLAPPMRDALRRKGIPAGLAEALAVPASAQLACAPIIAGLSGSVSLVAVPANLLATPAIAPATIIGVATTLIAPVWPAAAEFTAWLASWPAWWLVHLAETGSGMPAAEIAWPGGMRGALLLAAITTAVLIYVRVPQARRLTVAVVAVSALLIGTTRFITPGWPPDGWLVVACDVGQGDATVLNAGQGRAIVIDAGPDPAAVSGCLERLGITEVELLVISHFHADHVGGLSAIKARHVLTPAFPEPVAGRDAVRRSGLPQSEVTGPVVFAVGEAVLEVLYSGPLRGTRSDPNNNSVVLLATVRGVTVLLLGDAETEQQERLPRRTVDVLKVAHHGSSYQDHRLLDVLRPKVALVSVGAKNDYGHPSPHILAALQRNGAVIARTDHDGDIAVSLSARGLALSRRGTSG